MEGDEKFGCTTLPIKWGLKPTKVYLSVWLIVVIALLLIIQMVVIPFGWWLSALYCLVFIITPLVIVFYKLPKSFTNKHFNELSTWVKVAMLFGILSIAFFYFLF
jgi:4-hydroxybenzoate polyprenyltransferase